MIGTHNSMTGYPAKKWYMKYFSFLWKCQSESFFTQCNNDVEYFDIRIRFDKNGKIVFCHGLVDLDVPYSFHEIMEKLRYEGKTCRLVLERGVYFPDVSVFSEYLIGVVDKIVIKKGWEVLWSDPSKSNIFIRDYTYVPFRSDKSFWWNLRHMKFSTIKKWADSHNPVVHKQMIEDRRTIHFMDYYK